jgi:hypothetical protein
MRTLTYAVILSVVLGICLCSSLFAQTFRGGVQGTVTDSTGAVIPGADVSVNSPETGLARTTKTDTTGNYFVSELPIGSYNVTVKAPGFRPAEVKEVAVAVSPIQQVNVQLLPGEVTQVVEVTQGAPLIEATQDTLGATLDAQQFQDLPVSGRDYTKLLVTVPGSGGDPSGVSDSAGSFGLFSINGNRGRSNNYLLDGTDMNDGYRSLPAINQGGVFGTPATILPMDALQEVSVVNSTEAEYGRNSGATVNLVTKSGTNTIHGSVYEYFRNNALDARNFFDAKPQPQNVFHNNQFGVSLGGPIKKDKTFWFASYEGQREGVGIPTLGRVPTQAEFNAAIAANGGVVNPVIANLLARTPWPAPNQPFDINGNNLLISTRASNDVNSVIAKVDHRFGHNDILTGRYYFGNSDQSFPLALVGGGILPGFNTVTPTNVNIASISYTHVFNPRLLMEARVGYNRFHENFFPQDQTFNPATIGLNMGTAPQDFGLPTISVGAAVPPGTSFRSTFSIFGANHSVPRGRTDTNWQFIDDFTWTAGRHNWKFGYQFFRTFVDGFFDSGYRGTLTFASLNDFIAGIPASGSQAQGNSSRQTFQNNQSLYIQDNFRFSRRLTATYGLRWEYFGVIGEEQNRFSLFNPVTQTVNPVTQLYPKDMNNFAPRVAIAWDVRGDGRTVVRAGWGLYYDAFSQDFFVGQLPFNTLNPGPAYNGVGPDPITFSSTPAATIQPGVRVFAPSTFSATDVFTVDQNLRTPYIQVYNLNVQRELNRNVAFQVGYVGSQGRKLFRYIDINQVNPATGAVTFPSFTFINRFQSSASSSYNSLQASLRFRNWHGLTSTVNYFWAHSIDNASDGQDYVPNATQPDNSFAPNRERASSNFDMRQRFIWTFTYLAPDLGHKKWLSSGWSVSGVLALASGQPFNVNYLFEGDFNGSGEFFGRPDVVGNPFLGTRAPDRFLNLTAFHIPCTDDGTGACVPGTQHFGNLGRNAFVGPHYRNFDLSLAKDTKLTERLTMQLRVNCFNLFNHPNFANPLWPTFQVDFLQNGFLLAPLGNSTGRGKGFLPVTTTPDVGTGNPFLGNGGSRNIELAARFTF